MQAIAHSVDTTREVDKLTHVSGADVELAGVVGKSECKPAKATQVDVSAHTRHLEEK
jgi:hypothetical protein